MRSFRLVRLLGAVPLALLVACATAVPQRGQLVMRDVQFPLRDLRYGSGLRVVVEEDTRNPVVAVVAVVGAGSTSDPAGKEGLAHVVEHLAFRGRHAGAGTPSVWTRLEHLGAGHFNASTSLDYTSYETLAPRESLPELLQLEGQRLSALLTGVTPEVFDVEREVVRNELRQRNETGYVGQVFSWAQAATFPKDHPYARPVVGTHESLGSLTLADAQRFVKRAYRPDNITLVITGDVDLKTVDALVARTFPAAWVTGGTPLTPDARLPAPVDPPPAPVQAKLPTFEAAVATPELIITWPLPRGFDDAAAVQTFMQASLAGELGWAFRRGGDIAGLSTSLVQGTRASMLLVRVALKTGEKPEKSAELVLDQVHRAWVSGGAEEVLDRQRRFKQRHQAVTVGMALESENVLERAERRAQLTHFALDALAYGRAQRALAALDGAKVTDFAYAWLKRDRARVVLVKPGQGVVPAAAAYEPLPAEADEGAPAARPLPEALTRRPPVRTLTLPNGLEVVLAPRPGLPLVTVAAGLPGGEVSGEKTPGAPDLASAVGWPQRDFQGSASDWGLRAWGVTTRDHTRYVWSGPAGNVGNMLAMLGEQLDSMGTISEAVRWYQQEQLPWRRAWEARPEEQAQRALLQALYAGSPYAHSITADDVAKTSQGQAEDWMDRVHRPGNAVVVIAGEFDPVQVEPLVRSYLGGLSGKGGRVPPVQVVEAGAHARPEVVVTPRPGATQGALTLACRLTGAGPEAAARHDVMAQVVRERLWRQVREQMGATYGFHTRVVTWRGDATHLQVDGVVDAARLQGSLAAARRALTGAAPSEAEIARARTRLLGEAAVQLTTSSAWADALLDARVRDWSAEDVARRPELLQAVERARLAADFQDCAQGLVVSITSDEAAARTAAAALE